MIAAKLSGQLGGRSAGLKFVPVDFRSLRIKNIEPDKILFSEIERLIGVGVTTPVGDATKYLSSNEDSETMSGLTFWLSPTRSKSGYCIDKVAKEDFKAALENGELKYVVIGRVVKTVRVDDRDKKVYSEVYFLRRSDQENLFEIIGAKKDTAEVNGRASTLEIISLGAEIPTHIAQRRREERNRSQIPSTIQPAVTGRAVASGVSAAAVSTSTDRGPKIEKLCTYLNDSGLKPQDEYLHLLSWFESDTEKEREKVVVAAKNNTRRQSGSIYKLGERLRYKVGGTIDDPLQTWAIHNQENSAFAKGVLGIGLDDKQAPAKKKKKLVETTTTVQDKPAKPKGELKTKSPKRAKTKEHTNPVISDNEGLMAKGLKGFYKSGTALPFDRLKIPDIAFRDEDIPELISLARTGKKKHQMEAFWLGLNEGVRNYISIHGSEYADLSIDFQGGLHFAKGYYRKKSD